MASETLVSHESLRRFAATVQVGFGVPEADAEIVSDCLVEANLMGLDTHGVIRLGFYMNRVREGGNNPRPDIKRVRDFAATALLDGDNALGPVASRAAMDLAVEKARAHGIGLVLIRNANHYGPAGHWARMPLAHDMIGCSLSNVLASMPPTGGAKALVGNNPFAVAFPALEEPPVTVDGATSKASWGTVFLCNQTGEPLPADCYLDADGNMTVDPKAVLKGGCLLPFSGHKGYGIATAIELLTGMLAEGTLDHDILHPYQHMDKPGDNSFLMAAVRIDAFADPEAFKRRMDEWIRLVRHAPTVPDVDRVWLPGEKEIVTRKDRVEKGIPLNAKMLDDLRELAEGVGVAFDLV